eukprot:TRINITY_DN33255_c0_g1_i1.p1 TRINITY_DN33255_c0_g1~~TRINITY_DN33255_c0_g1_i1.p1  ORF type:complete len:309 (-),score=60.60 TRINITY_DN33255_c0_g1_i1:80-952(-)
MAPKKRPAAAASLASKKPAAKAKAKASVVSDDAYSHEPEEHFAAPKCTSGPKAVLPTAKPKQVELPLRSTALICIDFQKDFLAEGGFGHALGNDVSKLSAECLPGAATLLAAARDAGLAAIVHTKEAHREDIRDCPAMKLNGPRCPPQGLRIGEVMEESMGRLLVDGSAGNEIVEEAKPVEGEKVICKPGKGAFFLTDLNKYLRSKGVSHLIVCGVTTEVCVQTTMREANDRGYECVLVEDATASYIPKFKQAVIEMVSSQGGIVGYTVETAQAVADALKKASEVAAAAS